MKKLILIMGELAAGKTTLAGQISTRYSLPAFSKDRIKELLCDRLGYANREENLKLSNLSFDILLELFESFAKAGRSLILESNFRQNELDRMKAAAEKSGYDTLTVFLTGDLHELHRRYLERASSGTRHAGHLAQNLDRYEDFAAVSSANTPKNLFGQVIMIDTTLPDMPADLSGDERIRTFLSC
ncbi:MAG: AAA family ATPase [Clostridia bacterium]|nr:AAA family ATPase [Clostridia bacterium]MBR0445455.1 AAA family ATPase [Clostridia bacterium]